MGKTSPPDWVVIYDDLTTFKSTQGSFADAPAWGMQAVVYRNIETGWSVCTGGDYFVRLDDGTFLALDKDGLVDYAANVWRLVKVGRQLSRDEFAKSLKLANEIMRDVTKTAHFKGERLE